MFYYVAIFNIFFILKDNFIINIVLHFQDFLLINKNIIIYKFKN